MNFLTFEELEVWKLARQLKKEIRELTKKFPADKKYKLIDQIIRSSRSVGANIKVLNGYIAYLKKQSA